MSQKIRSIDRATVRMLRERMEEVLQPLANELGVTIEGGNGSYEPTNATLKMKISVINSDGDVLTKEAQAFKTHAPFHGLSPDHLNAQMIVAGTSYTLTGYKPRATKRPFLGKRYDGRNFVFGPQTVIQGLINSGKLDKKKGQELLTSALRSVRY